MKLSKMALNKLALQNTAISNKCCSFTHSSKISKDKYISVIATLRDWHGNVGQMTMLMYLVMAE